MENLIPYVIDKTLEKKKFDPTLIYKSLLRETNISEKDAKDVTNHVVRILIGGSLKIITAPMIREIAATVLLQKGLEISRLQYTRVGFPYYDLSEKFKDKSNSADEIIRHVKNEYRNVSDLIKKLTEEGD